MQSNFDINNLKCITSGLSKQYFIIITCEANFMKSWKLFKPINLIKNNILFNNLIYSFKTYISIFFETNNDNLNNFGLIKQINELFIENKWWLFDTLKGCNIKKTIIFFDKKMFYLFFE